MDAVPYNWNATNVHESFARSRPTADTLSRLAKLVARAEQKSDGRSHGRQHPLTSHSPTCGCAECGHGFSDMTELLQQHQEGEHALPKPHQCLSCGKQFSLPSSLQLHKCVHDSPPCHVCHGEPQLGAPCSACTHPDSPRDKSPLPHAHRHHCSPYACAPCGRGFSQKQALLYHQQAGCSEPSSPRTVEDGSSPPADSPPAVCEARSTPSDSSDAPDLGSNRIVCPICSKTFRTVAGLHCHQRFGHQKKSLSASEWCAHKNRSVWSVCKARSTPSDSSDAPEAGSHPIVCPICSRTFRTGAGLHCHQRLGHQKPGLLARRTQKAEEKSGGERAAKSKQKLLSCRSCDMVFVGTAKLYMHRKEKHSRDRDRDAVQREAAPVKRRKDETYPCLVCGRVFLHHLSLQVHAKQHAEPQNANQRPPKTPAERKPKKPKTHNGTAESTGKPGVRQGLGRPRKAPKVEEDVDGEFPCPSCAEVFSLLSELRDHVELHQPSARQGHCSVCAQGTDIAKRPGSKKQRLYHCTPCQRAFSMLDAFLQHCQDHLRVRVDEERKTEGYRFMVGNKD
ncbi:uncharacterized protein FYW47_001823 [Aplochiton taeniatus]